MRHTFVLILLLALTTSLFADDLGKAITVAPVAPIAITREGGQRWALIIGINDYTSMPSLRFARQDAQALAQALEQAGFNRAQMVIMTDDADDKTLYPTRGNLRNRINQIAQMVGPNDVLVIFFSGHGAEKSGQGYLVPVDGNPIDRGSLIPLSWVRQTINTCTAKHRLLILDACHSGAKAGDASASTAGTLLGQLAGAAFATISSCDVDQLSYENQDAGHGVFTNYVIQGLAGGADQTVQGNCDGTVTAMELWAFAASHTKQWSLQSGKTQTPKITGEFSGQIELTRFETSEDLVRLKTARKQAAQYKAKQRPLKKMMQELSSLGEQTQDVLHNVVLMRMKKVLKTTGRLPLWLTRVCHDGLAEEAQQRNRFALRALIQFGEHSITEAPTSHPKVRLGSHSNAITTIAASPNGALLASGDNLGKVILWSTLNDRHLIQLSCPWQIDQLIFSPNNDRLLAANKDGSMAVFDLLNDTPQLSLNLWQSHNKALLACRFILKAKNTSLVTVGQDGEQLKVTSWDGRTFKQQETRIMLTKMDTQNAISTSALSKDASWVAVGFTHGNVMLWNLQNQEQQAIHLTGPTRRAMDMAFDTQSKTIVASFGESLYRWDFEPDTRNRKNYGRRGLP